ncbi:branched-chain amino acid transport system permease protein [Tistlia consotensis]|uniref:Amino acid/amide ABC transporter membrane protein 2, HAAT family n=1 Tax=Tistlia consotensis USBA 355 TaxID=560819 RepID=A0A1Y6BW61_9PROT|nr:high-affinity branched-chain amino acid ABC transporter permease LivM [Tistlia consotensis]SMF21403.1 amino acid/amide ABC transporter membrane protein 2, HAAT family [Tistlia consotensis USBA 355]SNR46954.1 branched-chain amino acid transport system permease protein [Tistlia consotensis]
MRSETPGAFSDLDPRTILKEVGFAGLVALGLTFAMVGLRTVDSNTGDGAVLGIDTRFADVAWTVALVMVGRFLLILDRAGLPIPVILGGIAMAVVTQVIPMPGTVLPVFGLIGGGVLALKGVLTLVRHRSKLTAQERDEAMDRAGQRFQKLSRYLGPALAAFAIVMPFLPFADRQVIDIATLILTYVMLGWGLNIVVGLAGLLDLGYVAFYAIGAYSYALLAQTFGFSFWLCLPLAGILSAFGGLMLGFPVLRLRGDYLAIVTLGFGEMVRIILLNWYKVTGGPDGISGIPRPSFFGFADFARHAPPGSTTFHELFGLEYDTLYRVIFLYYLILALALLVNFVTMRVRRLPIGRAWEALREDDIACQSLGINRTNVKLAAFTTGAMFAGFAGSFFATRQGFISPESFTFIESAIILAIVVLGGMGSQLGVVFASIILIGMPEWFRDLEQYRMLAFGGGMVLIMIWRPRGLLAHRDPTVLLHGRGGPAESEIRAEQQAAEAAS